MLNVRFYRGLFLLLAGLNITVATAKQVVRETSLNKEFHKTDRTISPDMVSYMQTIAHGKLIPEDETE